MVYINNNLLPKEVQKYVLTTVSSWKPEKIINKASPQTQILDSVLVPLISTLIYLKTHSHTWHQTMTHKMIKVKLEIMI